MPFSCATMTTWHSRVRFVTHFGGERERSFPETRLFGRRLGSATRKKGKRTAEVGDKKRIPRNSASYARWHFQTTTRAYSRNVHHPAPVLPHSAAVAEKFKFTHRLPRVCFSNLWKMSLAGRGFHFLLLFFQPRFSLEAFLNPFYATLPLRHGIEVYCRSCRRVKTSSDRPKRY